MSAYRAYRSDKLFLSMTVMSMKQPSKMTVHCPDCGMSKGVKSAFDLTNVGFYNIDHVQTTPIVKSFSKFYQRLVSYRISEFQPIV